MEIAVSIRDGSPDDVARLADLGVTELVVVEAPPGDPAQAVSWVDGLAGRWGV